MGEKNMTSKTDTEVIIGGRVLTLSGYESEEYLQKIALYINNKIAEYKKIESFKRQSTDTQCILMELNIADDYFKAKKQIAVLEADIESQDQEICDLKHDLIAEKCKRESIDKTMEGMKQEIARYKELIAEKERQISEKDKLIAEKEKEITKLSNRQKA